MEKNIQERKFWIFSSSFLPSCLLPLALCFSSTLEKVQQKKMLCIPWCPYIRIFSRVFSNLRFFCWKYIQLDNSFLNEYSSRRKKGTSFASNISIKEKTTIDVRTRRGKYIKEWSMVVFFISQSTHTQLPLLAIRLERERREEETRLDDYFLYCCWSMVETREREKIVIL